jgi:hypothetical protein
MAAFVKHVRSGRSAIGERQCARRSENEDSLRVNRACKSFAGSIAQLSATGKRGQTMINTVAGSLPSIPRTKDGAIAYTGAHPFRRSIPKGVRVLQKGETVNLSQLARIAVAR